MEKIPFENNKTTVSQETFLAFQDNIEKAIDGTVLFQNWSGVSGDIDLGEDPNQYKSLKIFAGKGEIGITSVEIPRELYSQKINITQAQSTEYGVIQLMEKQFYLDGTYLRVYGTPMYINFLNMQITDQTTENTILIYKVIGFK